MNTRRNDWQALVAIFAALILCTVPARGQSLSLTVNRVSGATTLINESAQPVTFDGYTISSPAGHLNGPWNSLQDQGLTGWDEADNAGNLRLTEFNPTADSVLSAGDSLSLGTPYAPAAPPANLGDVREDLSFQYTDPSGQIATPDVSYVGPHNNVVLTVDPATGAASIQNESAYFDTAIDGYTITSAAGRLVTTDASWNSLQDQGLAGWDEADNSSAFRITEFNPLDVTQLNGGGTMLNLGTPFDVANGLALDDLGFEFLMAGGNSLQGIIVFSSGGLAGDFDGNGILDAADIDDLTMQSANQSNPPAYDLNADTLVDGKDIEVWISDLFGSVMGDLNLDGEFNSGDLVDMLAVGLYETGQPAKWSSGDFNGDGVNSSSDLVTALAGGAYEQGPAQAVAAVPEPSGWLLFAFGWLTSAADRRAMRRRRAAR